MNEDVRETYHSVEYDEYYASLDDKIKAKYDYVEMIIAFAENYYLCRTKTVYHDFPELSYKT